MIIETPIPRDLFFYGDVEQSTVLELTKSIIDIENYDKMYAKSCGLHGLSYHPNPIKIYINTFGGDVYACLGLIGVMKNCTTPIHTIVTGCAMSAGFVIAVNGHERYCYETSTYMVHQLAYGVYGKLDSHEDNLEESNRLQNVLDENVLSNTDLSKKQLNKFYKKKKDYFLDAKEAVKLGIVDVVL